MEYEEMRQMEKTHVCAQCDGELVTRWSAKRDQYELVCGTHWDHHGYTRRLTQGELFQQGRVDEDLGPGHQEEQEGMIKRHAPNISLLPVTDLATRGMLSPDQIRSLVTWGDSLGLKPYLGHVCLYFGKPYVTITGYYYLNYKRRLPYRINTHPLDQEERTFYQLAEGDHAWVAECWLPDEKLPVRGLGIVTREEIEGKSARKPEEFRAPVVHGHPQRMAEKRAEWQLLRKLIPLGESPSSP